MDHILRAITVFLVRILRDLEWCGRAYVVKFVPPSGRVCELFFSHMC